MTTIAYKDGIIAYDSRSIRNDYIDSDKFNKRMVYKDHTFFLSGCVSDMAGFMAETVDGGSDNFECGGLMVDPDGELWICGGSDSPWKHLQDLEAPVAFGSGQPFAIAAMDLGHTAKQAVKYAMTRDPGTGGKVRTFKLRKKR